MEKTGLVNRRTQATPLTEHQVTTAFNDDELDF